MVIYCDIDGTLTDSPEATWGNPEQARIDKLKKVIALGRDTVILWSANGGKYAKEFADKYGIEATACVSKPDIIIDDKESIRPMGRLKMCGPDEIINFRERIT